MSIEKIAKFVKEAINKSDFQVRNYIVLKVTKVKDGYEVIYTGRNPKSSADFISAKITKKGYDPTDVAFDKNDNKIEVFFEKL